jgi:DNA invertase Pin-like site-specific DNA recombinase
VAQRTKLNECLAFLRDGDALTVTKPDRLARSTTELLAIEADLSKRGVGLVVRAWAASDWIPATRPASSC